MTIRFLALAAAAAMLAAPVAAQVPGKAAATLVLKFGAGTTSKTTSGTVKDGFTLDYQIAARAGQALTVKLTSPQKVSFTVLAPDGKPLASASGVKDFSAEIKTPGDYRIRVSQTPPKGTGDYSLTIGLR